MLRSLHSFCLPLSVLILVYCIASYGVWLTNLVTETKSDQANVEANRNEALLTDIEKSASVLSDPLNIDTKFFEETEKPELLLPSQSVVADPSPFLNEIEVSSELSTTAEAVVFSSTDTVSDLQNKVITQIQNENVNSSNQIFNSFDTESREYVVVAEPKVQVEAITQETVKEDSYKNETATASSQEEPKKTAPQHEDIPSFSEWTQKQLAEAEKKKINQNETTERFAKTRGKFRNKNYASPDCGAKIVASNPESVSSSAVLSSLKDEYMLNYCINRIWFVVELCEAIQAKQLDLANFELFSSSPKHFSVFVSHRFPTRDWSNVGKFTAQDSRDIQTFNLDPHLFGKYVKVELHSHYGREQFCPISWMGVYGTSEYEVLAKEDERHMISEDDDGDQYEEDIYLGHRRNAPKNLFSSATDAVLSIVKKATAPFMKTDNNDTESRNENTLSDTVKMSCVTPRYITVCNNCSQAFYDEVFHLLSCEHSFLNELISHPFVKQILINTESCTKFGLDFSSRRSGAMYPSNFLKNPKHELNYLTAMLKNKVVAALCNVLAVNENKVVVNTTMETDQALKNLTESKEICEDSVSPSKPQPPNSSQEIHQSTSQFNYSKSSFFSDIFKPSEEFSQKIEPTKTLTEDEMKMLPPSITETLTEVPEEKTTEIFSSDYVVSTATLTVGKTKGEVETSTKKESKGTSSEPKPEGDKEIATEDKNNSATNQYSSLESIISDINAIEKGFNSPSSASTPSASNLPAESIFLRLANRIKTLEINMSLSSTYLEELSKRYRTQLELLSKTLNLTIQKIEENSRLEEEKERRKEKEILLLRMQLANLTRDVSLLVREKNSWQPRASSISQHLLFVVIEIFLVWAVFSYRKRTTDGLEKSEFPKKVSKKFKRRISLEGVKGHETPRRKARRPSDEALEIAVSRTRETIKLDKKRKRKKKDSKCSIVRLKRKRSDTEIEGGVSAECDQLKTEPPRVADVIPEQPLPKPEVEISNRFDPISSPPSSPEVVHDAPRALHSLSSAPAFMKTALAVRNTRLKFAQDKESSQDYSVSFSVEQEAAKKERKGSSSLKKYMKKFF